MKTIRQTLILLTLALLFAANVTAAPLDERQRTVETVVADALAQLPAATVKEYDKIMGELAATGAEGVGLLADMLVPASQGENAAVEYALDGVASFVTASGREQLRPAVCEGLLAALARCKDDANRAFLVSQLQRCATADNAAALADYLDDPYLSDPVLRALISIPASDELLLTLARRTDLTAPQRAALAYALGRKRLAAAEPILLGWIDGADDATRAALYPALASCGTAASVKTLEAAAHAVNYGDEKTAATDSYLRLLGRMADEGAAREAVKAAKRLLRCERANVRGAALEVIVRAEGTQAMPYVLAALEKGDIQYRNAALRYIGDKADEAVYAAIAADRKRLSDAAWADVIEWFGMRHAASQIGAVTEAVGSSNDAVALAGIRAAGSLGGSEALAALIAALGGPHSEAAAQTLLAFNGRINEGVVEALDGKGAMQVQALNLAAARRIGAVADKVFALLDASDAAVSAAAYRALASIAAPADIDRLSRLLDTADAAHAGQLSAALTRAMRTLAPEKQYEAVYAKMSASPHPERYYPTLAQTGTQQAIDRLVEDFDGSRRAEAFDALLHVDSPQIVDVLYTIAAGNPELADRALTRYTACVAASAATPVRKYQLYRRALDLRPSPQIVVRILYQLEGIREFPALVLAGRYLDDAATARAAASAVKTIAAKSARPLGGDTVRTLLEKSRDIYREWAKSDSDAGYAIDELTLMLSKLPAEGFAAVETDLSQWSAVAADPARRATMKAAALKRAEAAAAEAMRQSWAVDNGTIAYAGGQPSSIAAPGTYENFEFWIDCRTRGAAGITVRSANRIGLGGDAGSGALSGNRTHASTPAVNADNAAGEWNTLHVKVMYDRATVEVNGRTVTENVVVENSVSPDEAIYASGAIELLGEGDAAEFRDFYLCELPATPVFELSPAEQAEGYEVLFDGRSLHKWTGNTANYVPQEGTIYVTASYGGKGNLYTIEEYGDFVLRFEFRFLREGVNNGIGIRTPMGVDAAYHGMEIQVLDHDAPIYKNLRVYQQHGSVYGVIPAKRIKFGPSGTWNVEEIRAVGDRITVTVNGEVILDGDIRKACQGHNVSEDGSKQNPYTVDHRNHPGLFNKKGHIGLLGHGAGIQFRNIRIKSLDAETARKRK